VKNNIYDIEFTGGTSAQISLKELLSRQEVEDRITKYLPAANVYSVGTTGNQYEINTTETNKITVTATFPQGSNESVEQVTADIKRAQNNFTGVLSNLRVTQDPNNASKFIIVTSQMNQSLVKDVLAAALENADLSQPQVDETVNNAIIEAFSDQLEIEQNLRPTIVSTERITEQLVDSYPELTDYLGGIKIDCKLERSTTTKDLKQRFNDLRLKPDTQNLNWYSYEILNSNLNPIEDPNQSIQSFAYVSAEPEAGLRELSEEEWTQFVQNEKTKVTAAAELAGSLPRVRQFDPSVGSEQKTRAMIAIVLSLFAIVTYIWVRFGNIQYGLAAIVALVHDVCITLGAVAVCTYLAGTSIGQALLIGDFKINLAMIAAFLTLIGYSLNDTIVVFDRIRENRGKNKLLNPQTITDSINQTISRTILTSFTTFIVVLVMYIFGGSALRGFNFAIGFGVIIGTYSSIAIAAPILLIGKKSAQQKGRQ
jgi:SecD/SecF fusion protein